VRRRDSVMPALSPKSRALVGAMCALIALLALGGCSVGPNYVRPTVALNPAWMDAASPKIATGAPTDSAWWSAFQDSALDSLIQMAYRQNFTLQRAGLRIMEARAQLALAVGRQYPQIQAAFGQATAVGLSQYAPNGVFLDRNFWDYQVGFDAVWELDFWRKYGKGVEAERASYLSTIASYDDALVSLTAEVARTYAVVRTFEVLLDQARTNAQIQEEGLRIAQSRFRNGATSELDVAQATTLLESTRATIPELESGLTQSENALSTLLSQPTGSVQALLGQSRGIPTGPSQVAVSMPAELLRRRPDIRSVELSAIAQSARIGVAKADLYPRFTLFGSIGTQTSSSGGNLSGGAGLNNLFNAGSLFYSFGPRIVWPIFNYGRIKNNVRIEDARLQQLLVGYQDVVLRAAQEVEDGLTGYLKSQESAVFAANAVDGAQRAVDLAFVQYREGAVDFQRVLDAQRSLLEEQNTLARTRSSIATNLISLYKALGGGWEMRQGQPFIADSTRIEMEQRTNWGDLMSKPVHEATKANSPPPR
jgi:NodT family efflux transporter outer membrane factor (OMF) lipoprotein